MKSLEYLTDSERLEKLKLLIRSDIEPLELLLKIIMIVEAKSTLIALEDYQRELHSTAAITRHASCSA